MCPQINELFLIRIYVETDDLLKAFQNWSSQKPVPHLSQPKRKPRLNPAEVATILIAYHASGYKCFEYYYRELILDTYLHCFPDAPSYKRFVNLIVRALPVLLLLLLYKCSQAIRTGCYFIDSKKLEVCNIRREHTHKVFESIARKGKASTGWFYGLKLHLVINHLGQVVSFMLTAGNVADNNHSVLSRLLASLKGKCAGDKGYYSALFSQFYEQGLQLLLRPKRNMKSLPAHSEDVCLLRQRPVIESVNDILATVCNVEHSRHRNPYHGMANVLAAVIAYQYLPIKPHVFIAGAPNYIGQAA
jgi:hypothetical protein